MKLSNAVFASVFALALCASSNAFAISRAQWCAIATTAVANHCPPSNPTPPGGNTCFACAIAKKNCDKACGAGSCPTSDGDYPPNRGDRGYTCPLPYPSYGNGTVTINGEVLETSNSVQTEIDSLIATLK